MVKVRVDYSDGHYWMDAAQPGDQHTIDIPDSLWAAYTAYSMQTHYWHRIIGQLDNQIYEDRDNAQQ